MIQSWWRFLRYFVLFGNPPREPVLCVVPRGGGSAVAAGPCKHHKKEQYIFIALQRKISCSDVENGKLVPSVRQVVRRRGGKHVILASIPLSQAIDMRRALDKVIKDIEVQELFKEAEIAMMATLDFVNEVKQ